MMLNGWELYPESSPGARTYRQFFPTFCTVHTEYKGRDKDSNQLYINVQKRKMEKNGEKIIIKNFVLYRNIPL